MPVLSVRVSDEVALRFDAASVPAGGRSAMLRRLVEDAAGLSSATPKSLPGLRDKARLMVRLGAPEARHVAVQAAAMSLPRAAWVAALVRRHAVGGPRFPRSEELALMAIHGELRRMGVNVDGMARALISGRMEGRVPEAGLVAVADLGRELRAHVAGLGAAFAGNLAYWRADP